MSHEQLVPKENADDILLVRKKYFQNGDKVSVDDEILDLETSKTAIILTAEKTGYIEYLCDVDQKVSVGQLILKIHANKKDIDSQAAGKIIEPSETQSYKLSKSANEYATKNKIDLSKLHLSGMVSLKKLKSLLEDEPTLQSTTNDRLSSLSISLSKSNEIKALSPVNSSGLVSTISIDICIKDNRNLKNGLLKEIIFESSRLLHKFPLLNAFFSNDVIKLHSNINIGFAVDIDDGLKVLTIEDTDKKQYSEVIQEVDSLVEKYLDKKLTISNITSSTFTITDLSDYGVKSFVPLVNINQSAMLGVSSINNLGVFELSLSFDHRVTEGKYVATFLQSLKTRIEYLASEESIKNACCSSCMKTLSEDKHMQGIGFLKILRHDGSEALICNVCASGW